MGEVVETDSKGRIVIPSSIRNKFGLDKGSQLLIESRDNEIVLSQIVPKALEKTNTQTDSLKGFLSEAEQRAKYTLRLLDGLSNL
jgi:AbrB family looped-hinge helix DNA binding protein